MGDQLREWKNELTMREFFSWSLVHNHLNMQLRRLLGNGDVVEIIMKLFRAPRLAHQRWMQWMSKKALQNSWLLSGGGYDLLRQEWLRPGLLDVRISMPAWLAERRLWAKDNTRLPLLGPGF